MTTFDAMLSQVMHRPPTSQSLDDWRVRAINAALQDAFIASGCIEAWEKAFRSTGAHMVRVSSTPEGGINVEHITDFRL